MEITPRDRVVAEAIVDLLGTNCYLSEMLENGIYHTDSDFITPQEVKEVWNKIVKVAIAKYS